MKKLILATNNPGKIAELQALLSPIHCISQTSLGIESVEETGLTFVENALLKARHISRLTNEPALADDSGLVVEALKGEPGIYSARYAGEDATNEERINYLLEKMENVPDSKRQAYFYCCIVMLQHAEDPTPLIATGRLTGLIAKAAVGENGFGYDPVFYLPSHQCTLAQIPAKIKNTISHRAEALKKLQQQL